MIFSLSYLRFSWRRISFCSTLYDAILVGIHQNHLWVLHAFISKSSPQGPGWELWNNTKLVCIFPASFQPLCFPLLPVSFNLCLQRTDMLTDSHISTLLKFINISHRVFLYRPRNETTKTITKFFRQKKKLPTYFSVGMPLRREYLYLP